MNSIKTRANNFIITAAATAAIGLAFLMPGQASASQTDGPWPEPPSCSNDTGSCTSLADQLAYECFFEESDFPIKWCEDPIPSESRQTKGLVAEAPQRTAVIGLSLILK